MTIPKKAITILALLVLGASCCALTLYSFSGRYVILLSAIVGLSGFLVLVPFVVWLEGHVGASTLRHLSYASYGAYLVHRPIDELLQEVLHPASAWSAAVVFVASTTLLAFAVGFLFQRSYDWTVHRFWRSVDREKSGQDGRAA